MKVNYLAPITEIVYINAQNILEDNQDSHGYQDPWENPDLGANSASFEEEAVSGKNIWDE